MNTRIHIRKITDGSLITAIYAILLLISRFYNGFLEEFAYFLIPLPLIIYGYKYSAKDSLIVALATFFLSLILINPFSALFYVLPTISIGILYPILLKKNIKFIYELIILSIAFLILSLLTMIIFGYLFDYNIIEDTIELTDSINNFLSQFGFSLSYLKSFLLSLIPCTLLLSAILESLLLVILTKTILYSLKLSPKWVQKITISLELMPRVIGIIYIFVFLIMIYSITQIPLENNLFILHSFILNIGIIFSCFMIYQGLYLLGKYSSSHHKIFLYFVGCVSIFVFPLLMIVLGVIQNIFHVSQKIKILR